ncbi:MAG TPA: TonB-dependent receptor plug domain-containing protein [Steroidobacteraceae bacterium]|nr:TonB-dependent receptor plug domain-containing protein [Steroidobacteraceae bacterium]
MMSTKTLAHLKAPSISGTPRADIALASLLHGTGLWYTVDGNTVHIVPAIKLQHRRSAEITSSNTHVQINASAPQPDPATLRPDQDTLTATEDPRPPAQSPLREIIVTAEKKSEYIQTVPMSVTALGTGSLAGANLLRMQDYSSMVPALSVAPMAAGSGQNISIRGITTGPSNPTVGITIDDVPIGSSTSNGGGDLIPDINPLDLSQIEVLRGPQGTLYGASSMGGLIKFLTAEPSTTDDLAGVELGASAVANGAEPGYTAHGYLSMPLSATAAVRLSAFTRRDPGYIDNPVLNIKGINELYTSGGIASAMWRPLDGLSIRLDALLQKTHGLGTSGADVEPGLRDLQQNDLRGTGSNTRELQAYIAKVNANIGSASLTSVTGYNVISYSDSYDFTYIIGPYSALLFGTPGTFVSEDGRTDKFSQEFRLAIPIGASANWLTGLFYTHEKSPISQTLLAENPATGIIAGQWDYLTFPSTYEEYAAFTDLTLFLTHSLDVQLGARASRISQSFQETNVGPYTEFFLLRPSPDIGPDVHSTSTPVTYLVTPRLHLSRFIMAYLRLASGYRAGGPNAVPGAPTQYQPDRTRDYEAGIKGTFLDNTLSIDTSFYYIDWSDVQLTLLTPSFQGYVGNASHAKSQGVDISMKATPVPSLQLASWLSLNHAVVTQGFPASSTVQATSGSRLPYAPRLSGHFSLDYTHTLGERLFGHAGFEVTYTGDRLSVFTPTPLRQAFGGYTRIDLHVGLDTGPLDVNLYANNVANRRGILNGGPGSYPPYGFIYIQPRTVGLLLSVSR